MNSTQRKQRYLAAMGIERWVRRSRMPAAGANELPASWSEDQARPPSDEDRISAARALAEAPAAADKAKESAEQFAPQPAEATPVGGFHEAPAEHAAKAPALKPEGPRPPAAPTPPGNEQPSVPAENTRAKAPVASQAAREGEGQPAVGESSADTETPASARQHDPTGPVPRFNLFLLELGSAVLLVDEALLSAGELQAMQLQLLADVLRTGALLRGGPRDAQVQRRSFYWPQLEDSEVDQSLPRAQEALSYFLSQRCNDSTAFVLRVLPVADTANAPLAATEVLTGMPDPGVPVLDLPADLLTRGERRQAVWDRLQSLWRPVQQSPEPAV